jgi:hypothetical protein
MDTDPTNPVAPLPAARISRHPIMPWWVWVCSVTLAVALVAVAWIFVLFTPMPAPSRQSLPLFTVYPAPTLTEIPPTSTWTPEISPTPAVPTVIPGSVTTGIMVEVLGTGGDGLNLRDAPNTSGKILFRVFEHEVFRVVDGPQTSNGYTWWLIQGALDTARQGWAVENFLHPTGA